MDMMSKRGTCVACLIPTESAVGLTGEAEWIAAALYRLGVPMSQALMMVELHAHEYYGCEMGNVPKDDMDVVLRVCCNCAAKIGLDPALVPVGIQKVKGDKLSWYAESLIARAA